MPLPQMDIQPPLIQPHTYLDKLRPAFPNKGEAELELFLAASRQLQKHTGLSAHEHRKRGMQKLFPSRIWHEWRDQRIASVQECLEKRTQELMWIGSSNCISGSARILNPINGEQPTIRELCENGIAPIVMTLDGPEQAEVPFLKGRADLYEVVLSDGNRFTSTAFHRILTPAGYRFVSEIRAGEDIHGYAPCLAGTFIYVVSITRTERDAEFYDITVPKAHHYFAEGAIHHNSNKSADAADIALALWWSRPEHTSIYVASPYETATETGVWAYIVEQFDEARTHNPGLPGKLRLSDNSIVLYERNPRSFIRIATVDQVGKLVGKKARSTESGYIVIILDELPAFTEAAKRSLFSVMPNLISQRNLLVIGTGNFAQPADALGVFCDPDESEIVGGYDGFNPDLHHRWRTKRGGLCLRFDGLQSPNVKAGRDIYPFLTTLEYIQKLANSPGGLKSADAMRFIRSAPLMALNEYTVTNSERIRAGGAYDKYQWTADPVEIGAFVDPGFGGDPCVIQKFKLGFEKTPSGKRQIIALWDAPIEIPIQMKLQEGGLVVTAEEQIVRGVRRHLEPLHVPLRNIGFDGSLRAGIVQAFARWSLEIQALDSGGPATTRPVNAAEKKEDKKTPVVWKDRVDRYISELWFAVASLIDSFQMRGLELSPKAVKQLTSRRWEWQGRAKRKLQTKEEYKEDLRRTGQKAESPNEADALVGCVELARRMGLNLEGVTAKGGSLQMLLDMIRDRELTAIMRELKPEKGLRAGTLRAIGGKSTLPSGRLNRRL